MSPDTREVLSALTDGPSNPERVSSPLAAPAAADLTSASPPRISVSALEVFHIQASSSPTTNIG